MSDDGRERLDDPPNATSGKPGPKRRKSRALRRATPIPAPIPSFWQRSSVRRILSGFALLGAVSALGTAGYVALGWRPFDALFMVVITVSGVGFGEVLPLDTVWLRVHTMLLIVLGIFSVSFTVAGFVQFIAEGEIQRILGHQRLRHQIDLLSGHTIVAGFGRMGSLLCAGLSAVDEQFVLIEKEPTRIADVEAHGYLCLAGDATDEAVLRDAGLLRAKSLVTTVPSDAESVFITLTARQMNPKVQILARAELPTTQKKLKQAGADHVVVPAAIGAHRIVSLLTNPAAVEFAELVTSRSSLSIEMDEFPIRNISSPLLGRSIRDNDIRHRTGAIIVAIKKLDGSVVFPPGGEEIPELGDTLVLLGRREGLDRFRAEYRTD